MTSDIITSTQNPRIKRIVALQEKSAERLRQKKFVVEGRRELGHCIGAGFEVETLFICPDICTEADSLRNKCPEAECLEVSAHVYNKIAYHSGTEGVVAVVKTKIRTLENLELTENPLIVVLESIEKPGNLGAILRTADAAKADAVIICDERTDLFNPNLIRSAMGGLFTVPTISCSSETCIRFLKSHGIQILTAQLQDSSPYYSTDMCQPTALIMGTESTGLTDIWRKAADAHIRIPMRGNLDSLNVSVSAAILLFEAVRQREA